MMKKALFLSMLAAAAAMSFTSCKKDKEDKNHITYNNKTAEIQRASSYFDTGSGWHLFGASTTAPDKTAAAHEWGMWAAPNAFVISIHAVDLGKTLTFGANDGENDWSLGVTIDGEIFHGGSSDRDEITAGWINIINDGNGKYTIEIEAFIDGKPYRAFYSGAFRAEASPSFGYVA